MATLRRRLDRLEGKRGTTARGPSVILICDAVTGEEGAALLIGGGGLNRDIGECAEAFTARATAEASLALYFPDPKR